MKALLDTNIWIDIAARPNQFPDSARVMRSLEANAAVICFPLSAYTTVYYLLSKVVSAQAARDFIHTLRFRRVNFIPFTARDVAHAWELNFSVHEDACIAAAAAASAADIIVTRDRRGFRRSPVRAITPTQLLRELA